MSDIFMDTEFLDTGTRIMPISLGMVCGAHELYCEYMAVDWKLQSS